MQSGLVSITFRKFSPAEIISLMVEHNLVGVEWGGDVHVPPGDIENARQVGEATRAAGLKVAAYGSYYRCIPDADQDPTAVVETAKALGAPLIRVWAGKQGSASADAAARAAIGSALSSLADKAEAAGIQVALEFHGHTLTDEIESTLDLLQTVNHPALGTLWQPPNGMPFAEAEAGLKAVLPWLRNLHVFSWTTNAEGQVIRHPLEQATDRWPAYFRTALQAKPKFAMLEFICDDTVEQFAKDAALLNHWLAEAQT